VIHVYQRFAELAQRCGRVRVEPTKSRILFKARTVFATVAVTREGLDVVFVLGRWLRSRRIRKAQEEYPGIVHFLRVKKSAELDRELAGWLQEAYHHRKRKDEC
jgi:hypothetical protein